MPERRRPDALHVSSVRHSTYFQVTSSFRPNVFCHGVSHQLLLLLLSITIKFSTHVGVHVVFMRVVALV